MPEASWLTDKESAQNTYDPITHGQGWLTVKGKCHPQTVDCQAPITSPAMTISLPSALAQGGSARCCSYFYVLDLTSVLHLDLAASTLMLEYPCICINLAELI